MSDRDNYDFQQGCRNVMATVLTATIDVSNCKAPKGFEPNACFRGQGQEYIEIDK